MNPDRLGFPRPIEFDMVELGLLSIGQIQELLLFNEAERAHVVFDQQPPDSTLERPSQPLEYWVVDGEQIAARLPWLSVLYERQIPEMLKTQGIEAVASRYRRSGVTINTLIGVGSRYESHLDENPITGVLYATTHRGSGGGLRLEPPDQAPVEIDAVAGTLLIFDGRVSPHEVLPLQPGDSPRVSVPMNFFGPGDLEVRAEHIDDYIFPRSGG